MSFTVPSTIISRTVDWATPAGISTPEGGAVPKIVQNQGGATIGGPVTKNHTFFLRAEKSTGRAERGRQLS